MAKTKKPDDKQNGSNGKIATRRENGKIWSHVRRKWLVETPEERVRQEYFVILVDEYGFAIEQMDEELEVTGRGSGHARAQTACSSFAFRKGGGRCAKSSDAKCLREVPFPT